MCVSCALVISSAVPHLCQGGGLSIDSGSVTMISCAMFGNIATSALVASDVFLFATFGGTLAVYSNCAAGQYTSPGGGFLECDGCQSQLLADLLSAKCTAVPSGQFSCCGATAPSVTNGGCTPAQATIVCSLCPTGQFSLTGSTGPTEPPCKYCATAGQYSYAGGKLCDWCPPGRFNSGVIGVCTDCPSGTYSSATGATASSTCTPCSSSPVELRSNPGSSSCESKCKAGAKGVSSSCVNCPAGQYQPSSGQTQCILCSAGTYLAITGQVSSFMCSKCPQGSASLAGVSSCTDCAAGTYASNPGSQTCTSCPEGTSSAVRSVVSTACIPCSPGQYSPGQGTVCVSCAVGLYLAGTGMMGSVSCAACPQGTGSRITGAQSLASCVSCSSGFYSSTMGATSCSSCPTGQAQDASGQKNCKPCSKSQYAQVEGSFSCQDCPPGRDSAQASSNCPLAAAGRFLSTTAPLSSTTTDLPCPPNAVCRGGTELPRPDKGSWSSHRTLEFGSELYNCTRNTCLGAISSSRDSCWERANFASETCQDGTLTCSEGASGPLCGSCLQGFTYSSVERECTVCGKMAIQQVYISMGVIGGLGLITAAIFRWWAWLPLWAKQSWIAGILQNLDGGKCKILWATLQIVGSISVSLSVEWPPAFQVFLHSLSIFSFDFLSPDCAGGDPSFYQTVIVWSVAPIVASAIIGLSLAAQSVHAFTANSAEVYRKIAEQLYNSHLTYFLALTYLLLPAVLLKQFQALDCVNVAGRLYVRVDTSLDCNSQWSQSFRIIDSLFITLYLGIPALWLTLLCRRRAELNPSPKDRRHAIFLRNRNDSLKSLRFLFDCFRPECYYFEVLEMGRRVGLIGVLPLMSEIPARRACYGLCISLCSWAVYREVDPFLKSSNNALSYVAHVTISLTYGAALVIAVKLNDGMDILAFGAVLISINLVVLALALLMAYTRWRHLEAQRITKLSKRATKIEHAIQFNSMKFQTTFDALEKNQVPAADCLAFWYCSLIDAQFALQRGIPASKAHDGIIFSLHRPYQLDEVDHAHFSEFSAVVVVALPRRLLLRAPSSVVGPYLRLLSAETLRALRSPFFQDVPHPELWHAGELFFSPLKIVRVFQLQASGTQQPRDKSNPLFDMVGTNHFDGSIFVPQTCAHYVEKMQGIRNVCAECGWATLYHYTDIKWTRNIIEGGFRMSTQGQGDGGVYFSVRGPTSYGIGTDKYEENIIVDCFGASRTNEYLGKHMLDVVFVYGMEVGALTQAPGGRDNAFMVSKALFELISLPASDGNFFLRPDRILGVFLMPTEGFLPGLEGAKNEIESERCMDLKTKDEIVASLREVDENDAAIAKLVEALKQAERTANGNEDSEGDAQPARLVARLSAAQESNSEERGSLASLSSRASQSLFQRSGPTVGPAVGRVAGLSAGIPMNFYRPSTDAASVDEVISQSNSGTIIQTNPMMHQRSSVRDSDSVVTAHNFL